MSLKDKPPILSKWKSAYEGKRIVMNSNAEGVSYRQVKEDGKSWTEEHCTLEEWDTYTKHATRVA